MGRWLSSRKAASRHLKCRPCPRGEHPRLRRTRRGFGGGLEVKESRAPPRKGAQGFSGVPRNRPPALAAELAGGRLASGSASAGGGASARRTVSCPSRVLFLGLLASSSKRSPLFLPPSSSARFEELLIVEKTKKSGSSSSGPRREFRCPQYPRRCLWGWGLSQLTTGKGNSALWGLVWLATGKHRGK